jgi:hypothetical protein
MLYERHYNSLIERARNRLLTDCYVERHHVVPKCIGGTDDASNLVQLTAREHYVAHQLLVKMHPDVPNLVFAVRMMTGSAKTNVRNNREYEWVRKKWALAASKLHSGKPLSSDHKNKIRQALKGRELSEETKKRMIAARTGKKRGPYNIDPARPKRTYSDETRKKMSEARIAYVARKDSKGKNN